MQPVSKNEGDSQSRFGSNLLPLEYAPERKSSPLFTYPYARSRETLDAHVQKRPARPGARHQDAVREPGDRRLSDADDRRVSAIPARRRSRARRSRSTDATVYHVIEGRGQSRIGDTTLVVAGARYLRRPVVGSRGARRAGRRGAVQLFRSSGAEGAGAVARERDRRVGRWTGRGETGSATASADCPTQLSALQLSALLYRFQHGVGSQPVASACFLKV